MDQSKDHFVIHSFFGTSLTEYYLSVKANDFNYNGEGYAILGGNNLSFFNDKMEPIYSIPTDTLLSANATGKDMDDITMMFPNDISVNVER